MGIVYVWHRLHRKRSFNNILPTAMMTSLFIEIPTCGEIALPLQLTTGRSQLNPSYLMSLDFFEHWSTAVWNLELLCDQEVHEVEWRFGGIGRHYMRGHIPCISWTQVYKSAQAGVSSNQGVPSQKILKSFIFQNCCIWNLKSWSETKREWTYQDLHESTTFENLYVEFPLAKIAERTS